MRVIYIDGTPGEMDDLPWLTVRKPLEGAYTQLFGVRSVTGILHRGLDQSDPEGTPIHAVRDGVVRSTYTYGRDITAINVARLAAGLPLLSDGSPGGYGNQVTLEHERTVQSHYGHIREGGVAVSYGQTVAAGDIIGYSDSTGISTGPHLHWELRFDDGTRFDPMPYIDKVIVPPRPTDEEWYMSLTDDQRNALVLLADEHDALISLANRVTPLMRLADAPPEPADDISDRQRTVYTALPDDAARNRALNGAGATVKTWAGVKP